MSSILFLSLILACVKKELIAIAVRPLVYQKDTSERCRRHVMPSVFLAEDVVASNSHSFHFEQLYEPYSCSIAVKAEFGFYIIMVIQITQDVGLSTSCKENNDQLMVYEMYETYGGYWGELPDSIINPPSTKRYKKKIYTLSTEASTKITYTKGPDVTKQRSWHAQDVIVVEIPLLNVSGRIVDANNFNREQDERLLSDEFDRHFDVTPKDGYSYSTTMMPLLQFSVHSETDGKEINGSNEQLFDIQYEVKRQPDSRLTLIPRRRIPASRRNYLRKSFRNNSRNALHFVPLRAPMFEGLTRTTNAQQLPHTLKSNLFNDFTMRFTKNPTVTKPSFFDFHGTNGSWNDIENLMKSLKMKDPDNGIAKGFEDLSLYKNKDLNVNDNNEKTSLKDPGQSGNIRVETLRKGKNLIQFGISENNIKKKSLNELGNSYNKSITGNKSSFIMLIKQQNITHTTPSSVTIDNRTSEKVLVLRRQREGRKKRSIQAISIDKEHPYKHSKGLKVANTPKPVSSFNKFDFIQLVEPVDNEIHGHVALTYENMHDYIGNKLFNICEHNSVKSRHVILLNTSRIVIALNNFTLSRMTVVVTVASGLLNSETYCKKDSIECQVTGKRVCVDAMSACDGIPNCGSYEIYDEDHIKCGVGHSQDKNLFLAALTLIALLLSSLYAVHYWLKQCVPKVSDAFFIYMDGSENELYLESIMRSPNNETSFSDYHKLAFPLRHGDMMSEMNEVVKLSKHKKTYLQCLKHVWPFNIFENKRNTLNSIELQEFCNVDSKENRNFLFPEKELHTFMANLVKDVSVQTGDSLLDDKMQQHFRVTEMEVSSLIDLTMNHYNKRISTVLGDNTDIGIGRFLLSNLSDEYSSLIRTSNIKESNTKDCNLSKVFNEAKELPSRDEASGRVQKHSNAKIDFDFANVSLAPFIEEQSENPGPSQVKRLRFNDNLTRSTEDDERDKKIGQTEQNRFWQVSSKGKKLVKKLNK